ncbi:MAG: type II CAAX endopeptidase family protein [Actinobacteria bacterium]|nr:type II CAAX endopeptidase family protein [Actinomycetota bacterium]
MSQSPWAPPYGQEPMSGESQLEQQSQLVTKKFSVRAILGIWTASYAIAILLTTLVLASTGNIGEKVVEPNWFLGVSAVSLWGPFILGLSIASRRVGSGSFVKDYFLSFRLIDLLGIPIGVLSQVFLVGIVTWPFHLLFPEKFDPKNVEKRARDLFDNAHGIWLVVLVIVVVFGAPIVEELVYRGLIQGHLRGSINEIAALFMTAVWFAGIHLQIVEFPGLLAFAIVLGSCFHFTKRLGMSVVAHIAFNATGLILVALL